MVNRTVVRNLVLLFGLLALTIGPFPEKAWALLVAGDPCNDAEITGPSGLPEASCWGVGACQLTDTMLVVFLYVYSDMSCPNQLSLNYVDVTANAGYAGLYASEIGTCEVSGWTRGIGNSVSLCSGVQNSVSWVFPEACNAEPGVDPPPQGPPPPWGGGGGGGGPGCTYCAYNWLVDAGCHDANDTYCPPHPPANTN